MYSDLLDYAWLYNKYALQVVVNYKEFTMQLAVLTTVNVLKGASVYTLVKLTFTETWTQY